MDDEEKARLSYLRRKTNLLVIQNLAAGNVPEISPGKKMGKDSLARLKNEIDKMIIELMRKAGE